MPRNNSKQARKERRERALDRAQWTLGQYIAGIFRPEQNINYNPLWSEDNCIEKTKVTIANTERNLKIQFRVSKGPWQRDIIPQPKLTK